jgi:hypothetical protein
MSKLKSLALILGVLIMSFLVGYLVFAQIWQEPTAAPPGGNRPAPLNVGLTDQTKQGALFIGGGVTAPVFKDSGDTTYFIDPTGQAGTYYSAFLKGHIAINPFGTAAGNTSEIRLLELAANGTNYVSFKAPDNIAANKIWTLPAVDGTSGQVLSTNGSGTLSWAAAGGGSQNIWSTISTPLGTSPVPDTTADTLTLLAGSGISITGDSAADSVTIANTGDLSTTNEIQNVIANKGLQRDASNNFGIINCATDQIVKYNASGQWACAADNTGAGGGYITIQDEGTSLTQRNTLNFTGAGVSCVDNAGSTRTDCTIGGGGGIGGSGTLNYVAKFTAGTTIGNSLIFDNGTQIGIGTSSIDTNYRLTIDSTDATKYGIKVVTSSAQPAAYIRNAGTGYGLIVDGGNVGIGATSPGSKLDVRGITQITDDGATPDTSAYASFGVTRANVATNNTYIGLTKQGIVPWGIGIDTGSSLILGVAAAGRTIPTPLLTVLTGGNVGIGITNPVYKLDISNTTVPGGLRVNTNYSASVNYGGQFSASNGSFNIGVYGSASGPADSANFALYGSASGGIENWGLYVADGNAYFDGNVGIGTTSPGTNKLKVVGDTAITSNLNVGGSITIAGTSQKDSLIWYGTAGSQYRINNWNDHFILYGGSNSFLNYLPSSKSLVIGAGSGGSVYTDADYTVVVGGLEVYNNILADYNLRVSGNITVPNGAMCLDDDLTCTPPAAGHIKALAYDAAGHSDVAEYVNSDKKLEPGDVVIIDPENDNQVTITNKPYDTRVAGVISTSPGVTLGSKENESGMKPLAIAGIVPTKVTTINGSIKRGDLLTTSNILGYAMKATEYKLGTIVGKAIESLESGEGVINVLITLQ